MNQILRRDFDRMNDAQRRNFVAAGGLVTDPAPPPAPVVVDTAVLTRDEFFALTPGDQVAAIRGGRGIVDGQRAKEKTVD